MFNLQEGYAGTIDLVCEIDGELYIVDLKTSQYVWPEHEIQISAYKHAYDKGAKLAILQLGYRRNQKGWKFTEVDDKYNLFQAAKQIWKNEVGNQKPLQKDYPLRTSN